jgi:hypothetical protein
MVEDPWHFPRHELAEQTQALIAKRLAKTLLIRKLASLGLADRWNGRWLLDDPEFAAWVRKRAPADM